MEPHNHVAAESGSASEVHRPQALHLHSGSMADGIARVVERDYEEADYQQGEGDAGASHGGIRGVDDGREEHDGRQEEEPEC